LTIQIGQVDDIQIDLQSQNFCGGDALRWRFL